MSTLISTLVSASEATSSPRLRIGTLTSPTLESTTSLGIAGFNFGAAATFGATIPNNASKEIAF